ncbi:MAG: hypothetical protein CVV64_01330 [Candidatus Wallbacteria bacterium HGW-Wallbacteria-1]|jgi:tetratricopeptide (TPR) repeat protein|uniref:Uncharacterized protein n=1 Tax=Candidatus Wallbacteria bacterium HGW-Wallbacteria-1 TaxID=2013854 RepID=A0A2N1PUU4_9BACT|nr:MAG: hypothetical protein CVV64_01330 [Candidatus Wallbacteria bacterium HGW-Wallbacteria-1]
MDNAEKGIFTCRRCGSPLRINRQTLSESEDTLASSALLNRLREGAASAPNDSGAHFALAEALLSERIIDGARREYALVRALDPDHLMAHVRLGQIAGHEGDDNGFISSFNRAFELDPLNELVLRGLSNHYRKTGNLPRALEMLHRLRAEKPGDLAIHVDIEKLQEELSQLEDQ